MYNILYYITLYTFFLQILNAAMGLNVHHIIRSKKPVKFLSGLNALSFKKVIDIKKVIAAIITECDRNNDKVLPILKSISLQSEDKIQT